MKTHSMIEVKHLLLCFFCSCVAIAGVAQNYYNKTLFDSREVDTTWLRIQQDEFRLTADVEVALKELLTCSKTLEHETLARLACASACVARSKLLVETVDSIEFNKLFRGCPISFKDVLNFSKRSTCIAKERSPFNHWYNRIEHEQPFQRFYKRKAPINPKKFGINSGDSILILNQTMLDYVYDFIQERDGLFICVSHDSEIFLRRNNDEIHRYAPFNNGRNTIRILAGNTHSAGAEPLVFDKIIIPNSGNMNLETMLESLKYSMHADSEIYFGKIMFIENFPDFKYRLKNRELIRYLKRRGLKYKGKITYDIAGSINVENYKTLYRFKLD